MILHVLIISRSNWYYNLYVKLCYSYKEQHIKGRPILAAYSDESVHSLFSAWQSELTQTQQNSFLLQHKNIPKFWSYNMHFPLQT